MNYYYYSFGYIEFDDVKNKFYLKDFSDNSIIADFRGVTDGDSWCLDCVLCSNHIPYYRVNGTSAGCILQYDRLNIPTSRRCASCRQNYYQIKLCDTYNIFGIIDDDIAVKYIKKPTQERTTTSSYTSGCFDFYGYCGACPHHDVHTTTHTFDDITTLSVTKDTVRQIITQISTDIINNTVELIPCEVVCGIMQAYDGSIIAVIPTSNSFFVCENPMVASYTFGVLTVVYGHTFKFYVDRKPYIQSIGLLQLDLDGNFMYLPFGRKIRYAFLKQNMYSAMIDRVLYSMQTRYSFYTPGDAFNCWNYDGCWDAFRLYEYGVVYEGYHSTTYNIAVSDSVIRAKHSNLFKYLGYDVFSKDYSYTDWDYDYLMWVDRCSDKCAGITFRQDYTHPPNPPEPEPTLVDYYYTVTAMDV